MQKPFVHLHVHSHYSLLDGAAKVPDLVQTAAKYEMPAMALTDHGNLFGALEFYQQAQKAGIKPIIGYEAYMAPHSRLDKEAARYHLTLLAKDYEGYCNLMKLASEAYLTGFYYKPRIDNDLLDKYHKGIILLSGCLSSEVCQNLVGDNLKQAHDAVARYKDMFPDNFYIELQKNKIEDQEKANVGLIDLAREFKLPMVFTSDIHYLHAEDAVSHDVLLCIQTAARVSDAKRYRFSSQEFYLKTSQQMYEAARDFPEAADNTLRIADQVQIKIPTGENHIPPFQAPNGLSNEEYLRQLCEKGLGEKYGQVEGEVRNRFEYEYRVICKMGFASYFLIVWDFINYARLNGVPVGPGRGSAAGSIVSYALGITSLDPIKYTLLFERFLNEGRKDMPDIDIDFETEGRSRVIDYVRKKYGDSQVVQIITFGTMAARAVIRDVGRAMDVPLSDVDAIAKKVPTGPKITLEKALQTDADFGQLYKSDPKAKELIDIAKRLEGLNRQPGIHAAGVIIADKELTEYCPLYKNVDGIIMTQYSMDHVGSLGLLKMDFLGLNTLTLIQKTLDIIFGSQGHKLNMATLPMDDEATYRMLTRGETDGVFQLESSGMKELIKKLKPDRFEDIIALVALYRPGPLKSGMVDDYCHCKHGEKQPVYKHPCLQKILEETYGVILYQEQAMQIAKDLAGFTLPEADKLRKAMGKKIKNIMEDYRKKFAEGALQKNGVDPQLAGEIFDLIEFFSGYGFNKSHSAAYALVTYQTAYLKAHYPIEFMAALMTIESQNTDKVVRYLHDCEGMKIPVLPPDINESEASFCVSQGKIRFGLAAIKGMGEKAIEELIAARKKIGKFTSIFHLCENVETRVLNKQVLEALVKSGSMDTFSRQRSQLCEVIPKALQVGSNLQKDKKSNQMAFNFDDDQEVSTSQRGGSDYLYPEVVPWPPAEQAKMEKETLGFYLSDNPIKQWGRYLDKLVSHRICNLSQEISTPVLVGGLIVSVREISIKKEGKNKGRKMASCQLEDTTGTCSLICFPDIYEANSALLQSDAVLFIKGKMNTQKEQIEVVIEELIPVEKGLETLPKKVTIHIARPCLDNIVELRRIFGGHFGHCKTILEVENDNYVVVIEVDEKYCLRPTLKLIKGLEDLLGKDCVSLSLV